MGSADFRTSMRTRLRGMELRSKLKRNRSMPREIVTLQCGDCKDRNYSTTKNKKTTTARLEFNKFCRKCRKHTSHKEVK
jgi:large subunit ribosomal protein L33